MIKINTTHTIIAVSFALILAISAAIGIMWRTADDRADDFKSEQATFVPKLKQYLDSPSIFSNAMIAEDIQASTDLSSMTATCNEIQKTIAQGEQLQLPEITQIAFGNINPNYRKSIDDQNKLSKLKEKLGKYKQGISEIHNFCQYHISITDIIVRQKQAINQLSEFNMKGGESQTVLINGTPTRIVCKQASGCVPDDMPSREKYITQHKIAYRDKYNEYSELYSKTCPFNSYAELCKLDSQLYKQAAQSAETYADTVLGLNTTVDNPDLSAALADWRKSYDEDADEYRQAYEKTFPNIPQEYMDNQRLHHRMILTDIEANLSRLRSEMLSISR